MTYFNLSSLEQPHHLTLGHLLHLVNQHKEKVLTQYLAPLDITAPQFKILLLLYRQQCSVCKELSQQLNMDAGATTRMVDRLEKKGLLQRHRDEHDRRRVRLALTPSGIGLCHEFPPLIVDALNALTTGMADEDIHQLEMLLTQLLVNNGVLSMPLTSDESTSCGLPSLTSSSMTS